MSAVRDLTRSTSTDVTFEVERVGWPSPERLEVVGRWHGVRGRRFIRPTLYIDVGGASRRLLAVLDHKPWAVEDGESWIAAFHWDGEPVALTGAELTVGPGITVELAQSGERHSTARRFTRRPRADELEGELAGMRDQTRQLSRELHTARADHAADRTRTAAEHEAELEKLRADRARTDQEAEHRVAELRGELDTQRDRVARLETALRKARQELAVARADVAGQRRGDRRRAGRYRGRRLEDGRQARSRRCAASVTPPSASVTPHGASRRRPAASATPRSVIATAPGRSARCCSRA